jgi:hypothetical protein
MLPAKTELQETGDLYKKKPTLTSEPALESQERYTISLRFGISKFNLLSQDHFLN